jgi:multidrug efflux pump
MKFSDISIQRPVFATVLSLIVILLGLVGFQALTVREYPNIDEPAVTVTTTYIGASAEIIENQITRPLEDSLSGIEGIRTISSTSREGASIINIKFVPERDADSAASDVRDRVSRARGRLPDEVEEPTIAKVEADSSPIIFLVLSSDDLSSGQLTDLADRVVQDRIQTLSGVAEANIFGARVFAMRIWLDPILLRSYNLTANDVAQALESQNLDIPSGRLIGAAREFVVKTSTDINTIDSFKNIILRSENGAIVRLSDVARVNIGVADETTNFRFNGKQTVAIGIVKQAVANPLDISDAVNKILPEIRKNLPENVSLEVSNDTTIFIRESLKNVYKTLFEAIILVGVVVFLFLRSWRATLIPLVTIPISIIGSFFVMYLMGFSLNTLTLLALVLAIGLVVDDSIVVLENIYRHIENGMKPLDAAFRGMKEIGFAVIAMTLTLAAVYVPVTFMGGRTGKLFTEFALTLTASVVVSGFVALSLSPMLCAKLLQPTPKIKKISVYNRAKEFIESGLNRFESSYVSLLKAFMKIRFVTWLLLLLMSIGIIFFISVIKQELSPIEDRARLSLSLTAPEGATSDYMVSYAPELEAAIQDIPEIKGAGVITGVGSGRLPLSNQGFGFIILSPWEDRDLSSRELSQKIMKRFAEVPGITAVAITPQSLGAGGRSQPIEVIIKDSRPYSEIAQDVDQLLDRLQKSDKLSGVETDLKINTPQVFVDLDRARMADLGVSISDTGRIIELMLAGRNITQFKANDEQYDVILQIDEDQKISPNDLNQIFIRTNKDGIAGMVPLASFASIQETVTPRDLVRFNRARSVTITSGLSNKVALTDGLAEVETAIKDIFPAETQIDYGGQTREFRETNSALIFTFALALIFIFLVLAAQFESFVDPVIILITVPLSMLGALLALWLTGNTLNIYSQIGLITLIGLITKNGILLVEFANAELAHKPTLSKVDAIIESASLRFRPILMTTIATILAAIPLAFADGAGAESRQQLGWVIVGGMSVGTLLTLFVVPAIYSYVHRHKTKEAEA